MQQLCNHLAQPGLLPQFLDLHRPRDWAFPTRVGAQAQCGLLAVEVRENVSLSVPLGRYCRAG